MSCLAPRISPLPGGVPTNPGQPYWSMVRFAVLKCVWEKSLLAVLVSANHPVEGENFFYSFNTVGVSIECMIL